MEVHAHSHTERKKWTHYFWEFFMLFLAVTLGFLVENQREHYSDDPKVINRFCTRYHVMYSTKRVTSNFAKYLTNEASELIKYLQKEYHMK